MCGIAGFSGDYSEQMLRGMGESIAHRGPDDSGTIILEDKKNRIGMAHRRLSIIDLSPKAAQPMTVVCERCACGPSTAAEQKIWIVYNGELYNFQELRTQLVKKGHRFYSRSDTEVLLHLYAEYGTDMLERLNGIFAFAIFDGRPVAGFRGTIQGDLFLARDGLGVKPLYYARTQSGFLFASELKSLLVCPEIRMDLDYAAIHQYLALLWAPAPRTPLKHVKKARPGEAMIVREGRITRRWRFYDVPYGRQRLHGSEKEIAEELRDRVETAVKRQMVSDVPVGAFLSGGLDSSAVVAMMRKSGDDHPLSTYCIGFPENEAIDGNPPDIPYARRVAEYLGVKLQTIEIRPDIIRNLERILYILDEPQADPAPINVFLIAEKARKDGCKVLLSGAGGDDIFSGYRRHFALKTESIWSWLPHFIRSGIARNANRTDAQNRFEAWLNRRSWFRRAAKVFTHCDLSPEERLIAYFYWSGEQLRRPLYTADMAEKLAGEDTGRPLRESLGLIPSEGNRLNRMLYLETKHFLADHNLNYTDKASMAAGVETRVPLLDKELVDFAARIPPRMKQKGWVGKAIFKKAMLPCLPRDVIYRRKGSFGAPMRRWLHNELKETVEEVLSPGALNRFGLFDPRSVRRFMELDKNRVVDATYTIFSLVCIQLWLDIFIARKGR